MASPGAALARSLARIMALRPFGFDRAVLTVDDKLRVESSTFEFRAALLAFSFGLFLRVVAAEVHCRSARDPSGRQRSCGRDASLRAPSLSPQS